MLKGWEETTVDVLINEDTQMYGLFLPKEAKLVKKIPLSRHSVDDKLFWPWTQSGTYSCKSGYWFLKMEEEEEGVEEVQNGDKVFWRSIWGLQVPKKIKNFLWHAYREAIPTKANLKRRHITENTRCEWCWNKEETALHALWTCSELDSIWTQTDWSFRQTSGVTNFKELLSWILKNHGNKELFAMVTWGIWHQRNQVQNHKPCCTSDQLTLQAKEKLTEFLAVLPPIRLAPPKPKERWKPPDASLVKINFDGAIFRDENGRGIGVVVCTYTSAILAPLAQSISPALQPAEIEAIIVARALEFGHELGLTEAVLEGDSELIVNSLKTGRATLASVEPFI